MTGFDNRVAESGARILLAGNSPGMSIAVSQGNPGGAGTHERRLRVCR